MSLNPNSAEARDIAYHFHGYTDVRKNAQSVPSLRIRVSTA